MALAALSAITLCDHCDATTAKCVGCIVQDKGEVKLLGDIWPSGCCGLEDDEWKSTQERMTVGVSRERED